MIMRALASGWQLSGIYTYSSGIPVAVTWNGCSGTNYPGQGQCMPDLNPAFLGQTARINGSYGTAPNGTVASNLGKVAYINSAAFAVPASISTVSGAPQYLLGNAPRTRPFNLNTPGTQNLDTSLRRSFALPREMALVFEVDALNTWNKVTFAAPASIYGASTFGTISGLLSGTNPRDFQFAGHFNF